MPEANLSDLRDFLHNMTLKCEDEGAKACKEGKHIKENPYENAGTTAFMHRA